MFKKKNYIRDEDLSYEDVVKKEKRLSWFITFGIPIPMFILLGVASAMKNQSLMLGFFFPLIPVYMFVFVSIFLKTDKKYSWKNPIRSATAYFNKTGYERMVIRLKVWSERISQYVQFMIFVSAFVAIMVSILSVADKTNNASIGMIRDFFYSLLLVPGFMLLFAFVLRSFVSTHDDFGYCYSLGCFKIVKKFKSLDESKKALFIFEGLKYYDRYLRKSLKLKIDNLEIFYSKIIGNSEKVMIDKSDSMLEKLEKGGKFDLLREMIMQTNPSSEKPILVSERAIDKLKNGYQIIISVIGVIIAVIQLAK